MSISKDKRLQVYNKYEGHCAYCGKAIEYKDMQVDHLIPLYKNSLDGCDDLENLMPSCRQCNHYKRAHDLETFRQYIYEIPKKLSNNYIYKIGIRYNNIIDYTHPIMFYFETFKGE